MRRYNLRVNDFQQEHRKFQVRAFFACSIICPSYFNKYRVVTIIVTVDNNK